jgi:HlyD family secretion protein
MLKLEPLPPIRTRPVWARPSTWIILVLGVGVVAGARVYALRPQQVDVVVASQAPLEQRLVSTGKVLAAARIGVGSTVLGRVAEVRVEDGDQVAAGELLVQLDDTIAEAEVAQARAALNTAYARVGMVGRVTNRIAKRTVEERTASFERAEREWQRTRKLHDEGTLSASELDAARTAFDVARSQLDAARAEAESTAPGGDEHTATSATVAEARAALVAAEARLAATRIEAPTAGVVLARKVEPGDVVQPGATLIDVLGAGATRLSVQADEKYLGVVAVGQRATAIADAMPSQPFSVTLDWIAPAVDPARGTIELRFAVEKPPKFLRPDLTVSVNLDVARRDAAVVLPLAAVREATSDAPWGLLVVNDVLERRPLHIGIRGDERVEILSGVAEGDRVVVSTTSIPEVGTRVRVREVEPPDG